MDQAVVNLYLKQEDIIAVYSRVKYYWEIGCDVLIARNESYLIAGRVECAMGSSYLQGENFGFPRMEGSYIIFSVRSMYGIMILLKNKKITKENIIWKDLETVETINIGAMIAMQERLRYELYMDELRMKKDQINFNVKMLLVLLKQGGFPLLSRMEDYLIRKIKENTEEFAVDGYWSDKGKRFRFKIYFEKSGCNGFYRFEKFDAQILGNTVINHGIYNGVDTRDLEERMLSIDWQLESMEDEQFLLINDQEVQFINEELDLLAKDAYGALIAAQLWNNNFPPDYNEKSTLIREAEERAVVIYPTKSFSSDTSLQEAYSALINILKYTPKNFSPYVKKLYREKLKKSISGKKPWLELK